MNNPSVTKGRLRQLRGRVKAAWGKLVDDESTRLEGDADVVLGALEERVSTAKTRALSAIDAGAAAVAKRLKTTR